MRNHRYIPNQHGAWAMLIIPFLFGMLAATPNLLHALLFAVWILIYLFTYPLLQLLRTRKANLYRKPILIYGAILLLLGGLLLFFKPMMLVVGFAYVPFFLVNCYFAKRNNERDLLNDFIAVLQFCSMVYVAYWIGGGQDWMLATQLFALSLVYFIGTIFYVKTMIREKKNLRFYYLSIVYHAVTALAVPFLGMHTLWLAIPALLLLARAAIFPKRKLTIKQVGVSEILFSVITATTVLILYS